MSTRSVGVGAGWRWLVSAANLGGANPGAVFGGAALMLAVIFAVALLAMLALGGMLAGAISAGGGPPGMPAMLALNLVPMLPLMLVMACFMVGYLRLVHAVEQGQPASATDVFGGFRDWPASLKLFGFMLLLGIGQNVLMALLVSVISPDFADLYMKMMQATPGAAPPQMDAAPQGMFSALSVVWLLSLFFYAVQAVGFGELAIRGSGIGGAFGAGLSGAARNVVPLLLLMLVGIAIAIVLAVALFLVAMVVMLLVKAVGAWIGFVIGIPLYLALILMILVFAFGVMYFMWRDIAGHDLAPAPLPDDRVEI